MEARGQQGSQSLTALSKSHRRQGLHPLGIAVWVKSTDSGYLVTVDFSLFLPRTCHWNLSVIENYKFDLRSFHRAELRPLTEAINIHLIANTWLPTLFTCYTRRFSQSLNEVWCGQRLPSSKLNFSTTVGNKQLFTSSQLHAWITKTSAQKAASHRNQRGSFRVLMIH